MMLTCGFFWLKLLSSFEMSFKNTLLLIVDFDLLLQFLSNFYDAYVRMECYVLKDEYLTKVSF